MAQFGQNINYCLDFKICGKFSGKPRIYAKKQLKKFEYNMHSLRNAKKNIWLLDYFIFIKFYLQIKQKDR